MYGELPKTDVVFAACDSKYFLEHGQAFIYSANDVGKDTHVHIVNPTDDALSLAVLLNATTEVNTTFTFNDIELTGSAEETRTYYACLRFLVLPTIIRTAKKVLVLDIDGYIMNEFAVGDVSAAYFPREALPGTTGWEAEGTRVAAGAVYIADQKISEMIAEEIKKQPMRWFADQIALSRVFSRLKEIPELAKIGIFDAEFMDWEFKPNTKIWTGKGPRKHDNPKYLEKKREFTRLRFEIMNTQMVMLRPRLDIPFKKMGLVLANSVREPIRDHWQNFTDKIVYDARENGDEVLVCTSPRWMFNNTIQKWFDDGVATYVPHVEEHNWSGNAETLYYMQTVFPWLFTIDGKGWSGGMTALKTFNSTSNYTDDTFNKLSEYIKSGGSKFNHLQPNRKDLGFYTKYILIPLQLPHDETIKWHSDFSAEQFVENLCKWGQDQSIPLVFKGHPVNLAAMKPLKAIIEKYSNCYYTSEGNFQQMLEEAECVYVQNGGSGQEAMLLDKKVVVFADAEYNAAVIQGDINNLEGTWANLQQDDFEVRKQMYRRWYDWYGKLTYSSVR